MDTQELGQVQPSGWKTGAFFLLTLGVLGLCGLILYPFLPGITGAIVLAAITQRSFHGWQTWIRNRTLASVSAVLLVTVSIIAPAVLLVQYLVRNAVRGAQMLQDGGLARNLDTLAERFPQIATAIENGSDILTPGGAAQRLGGFVASQLVLLLSNSVAVVGQIVVMLFLLFFLYRDENVMIRFLHRLLPLGEAESRFLIGRLGETIRATVLGRLLVAMVQGTLAGTAFALLGVHTAVILGLLTAVFALVPPFGPYLVWLPVAIWFAFTGHWVKMAILLAIGALIISTLDNFLYPILVGSTLRQHTASIFLSLLGGVWFFGVAGLVLGPLTFSATEALLTIWKGKADREQAPQPSP